jgi:lysophospholipase L1-like esterase
MSTEEHTETDDAATLDALRSLGVVAVVLAAAGLLTYLVPPFADMRPWVPGEPAPLASLFTPAEELFAFAGTGNTGEAASADAEEELGSAVAANLGAAEEEPAPTGPRVHVAASEYEGIEVPIEDPTGRGMTPFYEALRRTALEEEGALTRITHYGDSTIATDLVTSTARRRLQRRFGDGGHGFILIAKGYLPYRHRDIIHRSSDEWSLREITRNHDPAGLYGLGGIQFRGAPGARASFSTPDDTPVGTTVSRFEIWYQQHRRGGDIHYWVDDGPREIIHTREEVTSDAVHRIDLPDDEHLLQVRFGGHGQPRLYGVVLEREGPGVVYDSIGLVGARAARLLNYDPEHIAGQLERRGTDLLVLGFGGNEAGDNIRRDRYEEDFRRVIRRMRAGREDLGCLVFAPLDQAERDERGRVRTMRTMHDIVAAQRSAAEARGCAFFDTWTAMGGEGAMAAWYAARPRLAMSDFRHATPAGYEVIGNLFYKALLKGFADYLQERAAGGDR